MVVLLVVISPCVVYSSPLDTWIFSRNINLAISAESRPTAYLFVLRTETGPAKSFLICVIKQNCEGEDVLREVLFPRSRGVKWTNCKGALVSQWLRVVWDGRSQCRRKVLSPSIDGHKIEQVARHLMFSIIDREIRNQWQDTRTKRYVLRTWIYSR